MKEFGGPVGQKYAKIDLKGREAVKKAQVNDFEGFSEKLKSNFTIALECAPDTKETIKTRVLDEIKAVGEGLGIRMTVAGENYPLHTTVLTGNYTDADERKRQKIFEDVARDPELQTLLKGLENLEMEFKYILVDKGNVLLTCSEIPPEFAAARERVSQIYAAHGLQPIPIENMAHMSVARITAQPDADREARLQEYLKSIVELRHRISADPIKVRVGSVYSGSTHDYLARIGPLE